MELHFQLNDDEFQRQFQRLEMSPVIFTHEAHLRLAWIHINQYGLEDAIRNVCHQIRKFAEHHGDHDKYNTTVTIAAVKAVNHFYKKSKSRNFNAFIQEFPQLKVSFKKLIDAHYSVDIFNSEIAKKEYLEPDRRSFDD